MANQNKYAQDGVNVEAGDNFSSIAGRVCMSTYENNQHVGILDLSNGHFRGKRIFNFYNLPSGYCIDQSSDGNGTKTVFSVASGRLRDAAKDNVAMVSGDMVSAGGYPLVLNNILDVSSLGEPGSKSFEMAVEVIMGLKEVADKENLVLFKGETAELGVLVGSENPDALFKFNWGSTVTGVAHPDRVITGNTLAKGQIVIALRENGFRANGISSVRKAFAIKYGNHGFSWWNNPNAKEDIHAAAEPSVSYNNLILKLHGWTNENFQPLVKIHAIAHITGGGIKSKLIDDLLKPRGLGVYLDALYEPPTIMQKCIEWRGMNIEESYNTWNMGQGMLLVIDGEDIGTVISLANEYGLQANHVGDIIKGPDSIIKCTYFKKTVKF